MPGLTAAKVRAAQPSCWSFDSFGAFHAAQISRWRVGVLRGRPPRAGRQGTYKIVRQLPVEGDNKLMYRIKNAAETFERIAEENQLRRVV